MTSALEQITSVGSQLEDALERKRILEQDILVYKKDFDQLLKEVRKEFHHSRFHLVRSVVLDGLHYVRRYNHQRRPISRVARWWCHWQRFDAERNILDEWYGPAERQFAKYPDWIKWESIGYILDRDKVPGDFTPPPDCFKYKIDYTEDAGKQELNFF